MALPVAILDGVSYLFTTCKVCLDKWGGHDLFT